MNIVFFGSDSFAVKPLEAILRSRHKLLCVVTQPDKKAGRGMQLAYTPIKNVALENNLALYQPESVNNEEAASFLKNLDADLFIVVAYGNILTQGILDIPRCLSINLHASLLPKYRGAAPINWAIINGEEKTGVTVIKMSKGMDAGEIILQKDADILESDTAVSLGEKLSILGAEVLIESINLIETDKFKLMAQDEAKATLAPRLKKSDGLIEWTKPARDIRNLIRGCLNWPGAFTYYQGRLFKIYKAGIYQPSGRLSSAQPGQIISVSKQGVVVAAGSECLIIEELQMAGKRRMGIDEFIAGNKMGVGDSFV